MKLLLRPLVLKQKTGHEVVFSYTSRLDVSRGNSPSTDTTPRTFPMQLRCLNWETIMRIGNRLAEQNRQTREVGALPRVARSTGERWHLPAYPAPAIWSQPFVVNKECRPDYGLVMNALVAKLVVATRQYRRCARAYISAAHDE